MADRMIARRAGWHGACHEPGQRRRGRRLPIHPGDAPAADGTGAQPVHGYYRAGSDHRKDGQAVGW